MKCDGVAFYNNILNISISDSNVNLVNDVYT